MPQLRVTNAGQIGLVADQPSRKLPAAAWTTLHNWVVSGGCIKIAEGHEDVAGPTGTFYQIFPLYFGEQYYWYFAGPTAITEWDGTTSSDRTRSAGAYTGSANNRWNGGNLNGLPVLNNSGIDAPQYQATPGTSLFADLDWDAVDTWTTKGNRCKCMRPHGNFLIAMDMTESGTRNAQVVRWSDPAAVGSVPTNWEPGAGKYAGRLSLADTSGRIIDGLGLGDDFIVYKDDSIHRLIYTQDRYVFRRRKLTGVAGIMGQYCVADIGGAHAVLAPGDILLIEGNQPVSIADELVKNALFNEIDADNYVNCFLTYDIYKNQLWVCYPVGSIWPNKALLWNRKDGGWSHRDLPTAMSCLVPGVDVLGATGTWATATGTWAEQTDTWATRLYNQSIHMLFSLSNAGDLFRMNSGPNFGASAPECTAERINLELGVLNGSGRVGDINKVTAVYPMMEASGPISIFVGSAHDENQGTIWTGPYSFDPARQHRITCNVTGRFHGVRFYSNTGISADLHGYAIEFARVGS